MGCTKIVFYRLQIYKDTKKLGFDQTLLCGYSTYYFQVDICTTFSCLLMIAKFQFVKGQNHMGYFATANEYDVGGYESILTFWGIKTAAEIRQSVKNVASKVKPKQ